MKLVKPFTPHVIACPGFVLQKNRKRDDSVQLARCRDV